jgi:hypothetical protein
MLKDKLMTIDLPQFEFENSNSDSLSNNLLFGILREFLDKQGIKRIEYALGSQMAAGLGELVINKMKDFWVVYTTERRKNFDVAIFSNEFHAVNYFIFRLTGEKETIDWSTT